VEVDPLLCPTVGVGGGKSLVPLGGVRSRPVGAAADEAATCALPLPPRPLPDQSRESYICGASTLVPTRTGHDIRRYIWSDLFAVLSANGTLRKAVRSFRV